MCKSGKVKYKTILSAQIALKRLKNKALEVYKCNLCKGFHLGHSRLDYKIQARITQLLKK